MPEWVGLEVKVLDITENAYGHKHYHVELPLKRLNGKPVRVVLSSRQVAGARNSGNERRELQ